jgi:cell division protein FtsZ
MDQVQFSDDDASRGGIYQPVLKVIGLGGGGCNAVERMIQYGIRNVEFIAANTDSQTLKLNPADVKVLLGPDTTRGLGAGGDPKIGRAGAEESRDDLSEALSGADMVFLTAGMGGGTGTGSIPVIAEIARSLGAVTIAIVTTPFSFEIGRRQKIANDGLTKLRQHTNTLITIPNDRLLYVAPRDLPIEVAFQLADDVLRQSVQGIIELITEPGMINVDFAHVRRLMLSGGGAFMSIGQGSGDGKAFQAVEQALHHPLLETVSLDSAAGIIANFTGGSDLTLYEVEAALTKLQSQTSTDTEIVLGVNHVEDMRDDVQVIMVITGLGAPTLEETLSGIPVREPIKSVEQLKTPDKIELDPTPIEKEQYAPTYPLQQPALNVNSPNLDIPAFLRRRPSVAG